jgi:CheY-like chemotaxis protein/CheY-specific phosphatase CheX
MARLLLLDESPELLETLQARLQSLGYEVAACANGKQALAHVEEMRFDAFILDHGVSDVPALELISRIAGNQFNWQSPVIVMTAHPQPEALFKVLNAGASFLLAKPFAFATLAQKVARLLDPRDALKGPFDPTLVRGFLDAMVHVVGRLGRVPVMAGRPFLKSDALALCDVNALMDVRGSGLRGSLCFSFHPDTVETLLTPLFAYEAGERFTDALCRDAVLEVADLVVGHAKRTFRRDLGLALRESGMRFLQGAGLEIPYATRAPVLVVPFTVQTSWPFYLEFSLVVGDNEPVIPGASPARSVYEAGDIVFL